MPTAMAPLYIIPTVYVRQNSISLKIGKRPNLPLTVSNSPRKIIKIDRKKNSFEKL
jgi:hypothetical protein